MKHFSHTAEPLLFQYLFGAVSKTPSCARQQNICRQVLVSGGETTRRCSKTPRQQNHKTCINSFVSTCKDHNSCANLCLYDEDGWEPLLENSNSCFKLGHNSSSACWYFWRWSWVMMAREIVKEKRCSSFSVDAAPRCSAVRSERGCYFVWLREFSLLDPTAELKLAMKSEARASNLPLVAAVVINASIIVKIFKWQFEHKRDFHLFSALLGARGPTNPKNRTKLLVYCFMVAARRLMAGDCTLITFIAEREMQNAPWTHSLNSEKSKFCAKINPEKRHKIEEAQRTFEWTHCLRSGCEGFLRPRPVILSSCRSRCIVSAGHITNGGNGKINK